ncbi:hypothetical protein [Pedobacter metabolipauper]|uniref:hypothetical protein n=1 Tax=Pedobacter metabolipauper TaxID=425513 RepID=UPI00105DE212|nr:hypothetical protein [Pedobacter metabolipauper]
MKPFTFFLALLLTTLGASYAQTKNKAPQINYLMVDGKKAPGTAYLNPGEKYLVKVSAADPENDKITAKWELFHESELTAAAEKKRKPIAIPDMVTGSLENVILDVPIEAGPYRLFLQVSDIHKNTSSTSIALIVLK